MRDTRQWCMHINAMNMIMHYWINARIRNFKDKITVKNSETRQSCLYSICRHALWWVFISLWVCYIKTHGSLSKKLAHHTMSILTGRKKTWLSHLCTVALRSLTRIHAAKMPTRYASPHTKFGTNHSSHFQDTNIICLREKPLLMMNASMHKVQIKIKCGVSSDSRGHMWQMPKVDVARKMKKKILKGLATQLWVFFFIFVFSHV